MTGQDFKTASQLLVQVHNKEGKAFMPLGNGEGEIMINISPTPHRRKGKRLFPKADVRKFLWEQRDCRRLRDLRRTVLWSIYDPETNETQLGLAVLTSRGVGKRIGRHENKIYQMLEVAA